MRTEEFLRRILPPLDDGGCYCWATPAPADSGRRFNQHFPSHISQAVEGIQQLDALHKNTYYAMAAFQKRGSREQTNVQKLKAFWLDIDCGEAKALEGKGYATKREAASALLGTCKSLGLPQPMVVDSGNGLHAYWPLVEPISSDLWKPVALQLAAAFRSCGLLADYACTADESRILRPIGTSNWKDPDHPKPVLLKLDSPDFSLDQISGPVSAFEVAVPTGPVVLGGINSDLDLHYDSTPASADSIADECAQMGAMRDTRGLVSEPQWRDCLGVIRSCEDAESVAVAWSSGHPDYNELDTLAKLRQRKAPTRCETFDRDNPGVCSRCIHWRKITSPIQLGTVDEAPEVEPVESDPVVIKESTEAVVAPEPAAATEVSRTFELPESMRATYMWSKGMMRVAKGESGWVPFSTDFVVVDGLANIGGETCCMGRIKHPNQLETSFVIPASDLIEKGTAIKAMAKCGVIPLNMKDSEMHVYLRRWYQEVSNAARDVKQFQHFGWQSDDTFLLGRTVYKSDGTARRATVPSEMAALADSMVVVGTVDGWREVVSAFYSGEGMEQYHFILGVGFGAPLMRLSQINGVTFSALSESGFGKTACERIMLAMYGNPSVLLKSFKGMTQNSLYDYMGLMGSLPVVVDEITTVRPEQLADLAYDISSGQSKLRLDRDGKAKAQRAPWYTIMQTSSNSSLWERLASKGAVSDAQWLRMLEFNMQRNFLVDPSEARVLMDKLEKNYGAVGAVYVQYLVEHRDYVADMVRKIMSRVETLTGVEASERFWSAGVACVVAGLLVAKQIGLIDCVDPQAVLRWAVDQIKTGRRELRSAAPQGVGLFNQMLSDMMLTTMTTDTLATDNDLDQRFLATPHGEFTARCVLSINTVWVTERSVRQWCAKIGTGYASMVEAAKAAGVVVGEESFAIAAGTVLPQSPVRCLRVDTTKLN